MSFYFFGGKSAVNEIVPRDILSSSLCRLVRCLSHALCFFFFFQPSPVIARSFFLCRTAEFYRHEVPRGCTSVWESCFPRVLLTVRKILLPSDRNLFCGKKRTLKVIFLETKSSYFVWPFTHAYSQSGRVLRATQNDCQYLRH